MELRAKRKKEDGLVGVVALWILVALVVISLTALSMAKGERMAGRTRINQVKTLYLAYSAVLLFAEENFLPAKETFEFSDGHVCVEKISTDGAGNIDVRINVQGISLDKEIRMGWRRTGGQWQAIYWKEMT